MNPELISYVQKLQMELNVIIVGAGLAGLASANGLRRAGHQVRVCSS